MNAAAPVPEITPSVLRGLERRWRQEDVGERKRAEPGVAASGMHLAVCQAGATDHDVLPRLALHAAAASSKEG